MLREQSVIATHEFPYKKLVSRMLDDGQRVDTGHWQGVKDVPNTRTVELRHVRISVPISGSRGSWASFCRPNLPWAENHFQERVAGEPTNPGVEYKNWPWYNENWEAQDRIEKKFSHTYQERFWPRYAPQERYPDAPHHSGEWGIRYRYGDLTDVLDLLEREPFTRQAYLPIFFPEDTGAHEHQRIPCTLGYHFMLRSDQLHCFYPMRSVDLVRYLRDDAYMAGRLVQWILQTLQRGGGDGRVWDTVQPGILTMFCSSLHVFEDELEGLRKKHATNTK